jgi:hypothetical protein
MDLLACASENISITPQHHKSKLRSPQPEHHQWFKPWMTAQGHAAKALVEATIKLIEDYEKCAGARIRARRPADLVLHLRRVEAITCNLAHAVLLPPPTGRIAVQLGHGRKGRSRYDSPIMGVFRRGIRTPLAG